ncbi:MAG: transposase [Bacteroides sp.]|nr:transposase [Bacteroides sp.]
MVDRQSVRFALPVSEEGIDGKEKIKGIKRYTATDKNGYILTVEVAMANIHDGKAAYALLVGLSILYPMSNKSSY